MVLLKVAKCLRTTGPAGPARYHLFESYGAARQLSSYPHMNRVQRNDLHKDSERLDALLKTRNGEPKWIPSRFSKLPFSSTDSNDPKETKTSSGIEMTDKPLVNPLMAEISQRLKINGPMSVADYMRLVLTSPLGGMYMSQDMFGVKGHFTTSPEISQIFGELLACWIINEYARFGSSGPLRIVELGPGRGTLASDIDRVLTELKPQLSDINPELYFIEVSPYLTQLQERTVCGTVKLIASDYAMDSDMIYSATTRNNHAAHWYRAVEQLPSFKDGFTVFIAHEFMDALPIHKFQRTPEGWREILVDLTPGTAHDMRYILSRHPTPASTLLIDQNETAEHIEVCPDAALIMSKVISLLNESASKGGSGCFLICDYGLSEEEFTLPNGKPLRRDTFRGFKNHELWPPLNEPGSADLTADVDFPYLTRAAKSEGGLTFGPVTQRNFLERLGFDMRYARLMSNPSLEEATKEDLKTGANMLMNDMGQRYKFLSVFPKGTEHLFVNGNQSNPPAGF